eukprot:Rmarinus@m.27282
MSTTPVKRTETRPWASPACRQQLRADRSFPSVLQQVIPGIFSLVTIYGIYLLVPSLRYIIGDANVEWLHQILASAMFGVFIWWILSFWSVHRERAVASKKTKQVASTLTPKQCKLLGIAPTPESEKRKAERDKRKQHEEKPKRVPLSLVSMFDPSPVRGEHVVAGPGGSGRELSAGLKRSSGQSEGPGALSSGVIGSPPHPASSLLDASMQPGGYLPTATSASSYMVAAMPVERTAPSSANSENALRPAARPLPSPDRRGSRVPLPDVMRTRGVDERALRFAVDRLRQWFTRGMRSVLEQVDVLAAEVQASLPENPPQEFLSLKRGDATMGDKVRGLELLVARNPTHAIASRYQANVRKWFLVGGFGVPDYVADRFSELSQRMSEYQWNGGGRYRNQPWSTYQGGLLPTDAVLLLYFFVTYMDFILPQGMRGPRFSTEYMYVGVEEKPRAPAQVAIMLEGRVPPILSVLSDDIVWQVDPGPYNLFNAIALFFHYIQFEQSGKLGTRDLDQMELRLFDSPPQHSITAFSLLPQPIFS